MANRLPLFVVAAGLALVSCSSNASGAPTVASLGTTSSATSVTAPPNADGRPRYRLNMSATEQQTIESPYIKCMIDHGVASTKDQKINATQAHDESQNTLDAAKTACADKVPLPPWENDPQNPAALDFNRKVMSCLPDKGIRNVRVGQYDGEVTVAFGGIDDQQDVSRGMQFLPGCQQEASQQH
jgi:hypothetical protein